MGPYLGTRLGPVIVGKFNAPDIPLKVMEHFDFEDVQDTKDVGPWRPVPTTKSHELFVSTDQSHSGQASLRLKFDTIQPITQGNEEHGGLGLLADNYPRLESERLVAASAWVLLPRSEHVQDNDLHTHVIGYTSLSQDDYMGVYSQDLKLVPGEWTPVFWGAAYQAEFRDSSFVSSDNRFLELYLTIWDEVGPYDGSIYIDEITLYTNEDS